MRTAHGWRAPTIRWARMPNGLWHYTSEAFAVGIDRDGFLRPGIELMDLDVVDAHPERATVRALSAVVWLTDLPDITDRTRDRVGLTQHTIKQDRTEVRYRVDPDTPVGHIFTFEDWIEQGQIDPALASRLLRESSAADLSNWYVSPHRVRVTRSERP